MGKIAQFYGHSTTEENLKPVASLAYTEIDAVYGSIIQLDGRASRDPEGEPLQFKWKFIQVPTTSGIDESNIKNIRPDGSAISFTPDVLGLYIVQLMVNDGELDSDPVIASINIKLDQVPVGEGLVPDARFLWNYVSDFWGLVEDRDFIASIWSSVIQCIGSEYIKLWSNDYDKSLETIQPTVQRRWQKFAPRTSLIDRNQSVIVGNGFNGSDGHTGSPGEAPGNVRTSLFYTPSRPPIFDLTRSAPYRYTEDVSYYVEAGVDGSGAVTIPAGSYNAEQLSTEFNPRFIAEGLQLVASDHGGRLRISGTTGGRNTEVTISIPAYDKDPVFGRVQVKSKGKDLLQLVPNFGAKGRLAVIGGVTHVINSVYESVYEGVNYSTLVTEDQIMFDGMIGLQWGIPQLLYVPGYDVSAAGICTGDVIVFEVTRKDTNHSAELRARVVGVSGDRIGFEFTLDDTPPGGEIIDRDLMVQLVRDLRIASHKDTEVEAASKTEALLAYMPRGINLVNRPFSKYRVVIKAKEIIHNSKIPVTDELVSMPALQEAIFEPPLILRENLDYVTGDGWITFSNGLFTTNGTSPPELWAEVVFYDNSSTIEGNFGKLVHLSRDDLTKKQSRVPYLSAIKGLAYAYTSSSSIANTRLGLQILLGLPFAEERCQIIEIEDPYTVDSQGVELSRILTEDVDQNNRKLGIRRIYFFPTVLGIEKNPTTGKPFAVSDVAQRWYPLSGGIEVTDYIKDPLWWRNALNGLEILKFFVFRVAINSEIFDLNDASIAREFVNKIKPGYTKVLMNIRSLLYDEIHVEDRIGGNMTLSTTDDTMGFEAAYGLGLVGSSMFPLHMLGSRPLTTRVKPLLHGVRTHTEYVPPDPGGAGFGSGGFGVVGYGGGVPGYTRVFAEFPGEVLHIRGRVAAGEVYPGSPAREGDILCIAPRQNGSSDLHWGLYEIGEILDSKNVELICRAPNYDRTTFEYTPLGDDGFITGSGLLATIVRRETNPMAMGYDLITNDTDNVVVAPSALFLMDAIGVDDHLIIEWGPNAGEYRIDGVAPSPPFTFNNEVSLKNLDGTVPLFVADQNQPYRVIRPSVMSNTIQGVQSLNMGGTMQLHVLDLSTGDQLDVFTPGLVGTVVNVSAAHNPDNNGEFLVTGYVGCGKILTSAPLEGSDSLATATVKLSSMWHRGYENFDELSPDEHVTVSLSSVVSP